jgi:hypothetical protein
MNDELTELLEREAAKRDRNWNPALRWKVLQETIAWVDAQAKIPRNSKAACLANQARLLARQQIVAQGK